MSAKTRTRVCGGRAVASNTGETFLRYSEDERRSFSYGLQYWLPGDLRKYAEDFLNTWNSPRFSIVAREKVERSGQRPTKPTVIYCFDKGFYNLYPIQIF